MDIAELTRELAHRSDMDLDAARELADEYLSQAEAVDDRKIDRSDISDDDAQTVFTAAEVGETLDPQSPALGEIEDMTARIGELTHRIGDIADRRNELIVRAYHRGTSVPRLTSASGLNRSRIYAILKKA
jgi:hypothetical protein